MFEKAEEGAGAMQKTRRQFASAVGELKLLLRCVLIGSLCFVFEMFGGSTCGKHAAIVVELKCLRCKSLFALII